jgi:predicted nucleotidyltransferase component of viral defense system
MIPAQNIIAWSKAAPWAEHRQVEQDLIISRALVALFSDDFLKEQLRVRGGTALNKLHFPAPLRYSEDIDLVRTTEGGIGPVLDRTRAALEPWLGRANFSQSDVAPKLRFEVEAEDGSAPIKLKVEINTRERIVYDKPATKCFSVSNPWFTGKAEIATFTNEELLATKLRALLQRRKGRDLLDLSHALAVFDNLDAKRTVEIFGKYLSASGLSIPRAEGELRMFGKLDSRTFLADVKPLLTVEEAARFDDAAGLKAFASVFSSFIQHLPGKPWPSTADKIEEHGLADLI